MLADLEAEVRPLVEVVRAAIADVMAGPGGEPAGQFLAAAPVEACVRLADAWADAEAAGLDTDSVKARFDAEDQLLIEIVTSVYTAARPGAGPVGGVNLHEVARLLDGITITPPPLAVP